MASQLGLERLLVVVIEDIFAPRKQSSDHRIGARHELHDPRVRDAREPGDERPQRHVGAEAQMVDERQRQHEVGLPSLVEPLAFALIPALLR